MFGCKISSSAPTVSQTMGYVKVKEGIVMEIRKKC